MIFNLEEYIMDKSKQGIKIENGVVIKTHTNKENLNNEIEIVKKYGRYVKVPKILDISEHNITYELINGTSAMSNTDYGVTRDLIEELAIFHSLFRKNRSSVLYRDAITSNSIISEQVIYQIDFSSSNRLVHCFDDLALLVNPNWNQAIPDDFITDYLIQREKFDSKFGLDEKLRELTDYKSIIRNMSQFCEPAFEEEIDKVSFSEIRRKDYIVFNKFREYRAEFYKNLWGISNDSQNK
jgi:hypothetical protein